MRNVKTSEKGSVLTLVIDLSKDLGPSKSGKTQIIATTGGAVRLASGAAFNLNVYK